MRTYIYAYVAWLNRLEDDSISENESKKKE